MLACVVTVLPGVCSRYHLIWLRPIASLDLDHRLILPKKTPSKLFCTIWENKQTMNKNFNFPVKAWRIRL